MPPVVRPLIAGDVKRILGIVLMAYLNGSPATPASALLATPLGSRALLLRMGVLFGAS